MDYFLNKGVRKMQADLDIIQLLRMQKGYRIMKQVLLNIDDLFLLKN